MAESRTWTLGRRTDLAFGSNQGKDLVFELDGPGAEARRGKSDNT